MALLAAANTATSPIQPVPQTIPEEEWPEMQTCKEIADHTRRVRDLGLTGRYQGLMGLMENSCPDEFRDLEEEERQGSGRTMQG